MQRYLGELTLLGVTALAAVGWLVSKFAVAELPGGLFLAIRFLAAAVLFLPFSGRQLCRLNRSEWLRAAAVGLAFFANIMLWMLGVMHSTHLGEGAFLMSLSMLLAPLLAWPLFGYRPLRVFWFSLALAVFGLYWLNAGRPLAQFSLGSAFFASAALMGAVFFVLNNQFAKNLPTLALATVQMAVAGVLCAVYALIFEKFPPQVSWTTWGWVALSVTLITNVRYFLQTYGQKTCAIGTAAVIMVLEPLWTLLLSIVFLGEILTWQKMLGGMLILTALLVYRLPLHRLGKRFRLPEKRH